MPRNVEIKAKVADPENLIKNAKLLAGDDGIITEQEDTFFNAPNGRLKLRNIKGEQSVLIHYNRPDQEGPKLSDFHTATVDDVEAMKIVLTDALGVKGVVKKSRLLIMLGQTRIHIDDVHGLGHFMELEVMLQDDQSVEDGQKIAEEIMDKLDISSSELLDCAYTDMILKNK
uniref:CYTH domain-containing protein n=1 Tax=Arion vulgaris TaxID=1028688 RepID=A0A0B6YQD8_9EUPU